MGLTAAELLVKLDTEFGCKKTSFYNRKKELEDLKYNLEPTKNGRESFYSDEQVQVIVDYLSWIGDGKDSGEFPKSEQESLVRQEPAELDTEPEIDFSNPARNSSRRLDEKAQVEAANLDMLVTAYRATKNYTVPGLGEQIEQGKEALHKYEVSQLGNVTSLIPEVAKKFLSTNQTENLDLSE